MCKKIGVSERHNLFYANAPRMWTDGLILGNGDLGAVFYAPYHLKWLINKTDVYDYRTNIPPRLTHSEILEGIKAGKNIQEIRASKKGIHSPLKKSGPKSCAKLQVCFDKVSSASNWSPPHKISALLDLPSATLNIKADKHQSHPRIQSFIDAESNLLAIRIKDNSHLTPPAIIELISIDEPDMPPVEWTVKDNAVYMTRNIPDSMTVVTAIKILPTGWGGFAETMKEHFREKFWSLPTEVPEPVTDKIKSCFMVQGDFDIFLTSVTTEESENPLAEAEKILNTAAAKGFDESLKGHTRWWNIFWEKSSVRLALPVLEKLWYFSLYALVSQYRRAPVPALLGLAYGLPEEPGKGLPWSGIYTNDQNSQMPAMPTWAVNHPELGEAYCETFIRMLDEAKSSARTLFNMDGAYYPSSCDPKGRELIGDQYTYIFSGPYLGIPFVWAWNYTKDLNILKKYSYPYCREQAIFFSNYCTWNEDKKRYRLWPAIPPEQPILNTGDPTHTLSCLKVVLKHAIEGSNLLKVDESLREKWEHLLNHFPEYPTSGGIFLESDAYDENHYISQVGGMYPLFPCGEYGEESKKEVLENCLKTYRTSFLRNALQLLSQKKGVAPQNGWMWFFWNMDALRLGLKEEAWEMLYELGLRLFLKPNGLFTHNAVILADPVESEANYNNYPEITLDDCGEKMSVKEPWSGHNTFSSPVLDGKEYVFPVLENTASYLMILTEMLLQGHQGIIRLFPGWPENRPALFKNLRVEGAFLISAAKDKKNILYCRVKSLKGGKIRLRVPWEKTFVAMNGSENFSEIKKEDDYLILKFKEGEEGLFSPLPKKSDEPLFEEFLTGPEKILFKDGSHSWYGKPEWHEYYKK